MDLVFLHIDISLVARDRWTRVSALCPRHVRVRDFLKKVMSVSASADKSVRVHRRNYGFYRCVNEFDVEISLEI